VLREHAGRALNLKTIAGSAALPHCTRTKTEQPPSKPAVDAPPEARPVFLVRNAQHFARKRAR